MDYLCDKGCSFGDNIDCWLAESFIRSCQLLSFTHCSVTTLRIADFMHYLIQANIGRNNLLPLHIMAQLCSSGAPMFDRLTN